MSNQKEVWKAITIDGKKPIIPYMISNYGRFGVMDNGKVQVRTFKPTAGNYRYNTRQQGKNKSIFLTKEVAKAFLAKSSPKQKYIIHKDHDYLNNHVNNLKWATQEEHRTHTTMSPNSILARKRKAITKSLHSQVFNEKSVATLKKMIWDPKRKLSFKQLAEKFGVSEMQIYRIKNGDFWYHVRVENEPLHPKYKQNLSNIEFHEKKLVKAQLERERQAASKRKRAEAKAAEEAAKKAKQKAKKVLAPKVKKVKISKKPSDKSLKLLKLAKFKKSKKREKKAAKNKGYTLVKLVKKRRN